MNILEGIILPWAYLLLLVAQYAVRAQDSSSSSAMTCKNTRNGRHYLTDTSGRVCSRQQMDFATGCCPDSIEPYSCETCKDLDGCCSSYEHCVSCCMAPQHVPKERMAETYIGLFKADTGHWSNEFDYCKSACRTTSRSTQNENTYIGERKYCYSEERRPRDSEPVTFHDDRFVAKGAAGASCEDACKAQNAVCSDEDTSPINTCDELRAAFMCEAGCSPTVQLGESASDEYPGYVGVKAPKNDRPGTCFIQGSADSTGPARSLLEVLDTKCDAKSKFVHRLCICRRRASSSSSSSMAPASGQSHVGSDEKRR